MLLEHACGSPSLIYPLVFPPIFSIPQSLTFPCPLACTQQADSPTPEAVLERQLPAKSRHVESLTVANWLHKPQRFKVSVERITADKATRLEGSEYIDVPAGAERQYKLAFYSYTQVGGMLPEGCICIGLKCAYFGP